MIGDILNRFRQGEALTREELVQLLKISTGSEAYYQLLATANAYSRRQFHMHGTVFGQIGLDNQPCRINCKFCSLAAAQREKLPCMIRSAEDTVRQALDLAEAGAEDVFLMTTAEFSQQAFLSYCRAVRKALPEGLKKCIPGGLRA